MRRTFEVIKKSILMFISGTFFMCAVSGCTTQALYESVKEGAKNNCLGQPPSEAERCLEALNKRSFDEYNNALPAQK